MGGLRRLRIPRRTALLLALFVGAWAAEVSAVWGYPGTFVSYGDVQTIPELIRDGRTMTRWLVLVSTYLIVSVFTIPRRARSPTPTGSSSSTPSRVFRSGVLSTRSTSPGPSGRPPSGEARRPSAAWIPSVGGRRLSGCALPGSRYAAVIRSGRALGAGVGGPP